MLPLGYESDASFYNLIHHLAESGAVDGSAERRDNRRVAFRALQRIAPDRSQGVPDASEFVEVRCHDLNRHGFSFLLPDPPQFDSLVVAFGSPPKVIYLAARVSHCADVLVHSSGLIERVDDRTEPDESPATDGQGARAMVLVGCRFVRRLSR